MIKLEINGTTVVLTRPTGGLPTQVERLLKEKQPRCVVFIDCAPSEGLLKAVGWVSFNLPRTTTTVIRDHHDVEAITCEADVQRAIYAERLRTYRRVNAVIVTRSDSPACSSLLELGEFRGSENVVIADDDLDGILAALKAAGVSYPELDSDAAILDGPHELKSRRHGLSETAELFSNALVSVPALDRKNRGPYEEARTRVIELFVRFLQGDPGSRDELVSLSQAHMLAVGNAYEMADAAVEMLPAVWQSSAVGIQGNYDGGALFRALAERGALIIVIEKSQGALADRYGGRQLQVQLTNAGTERGLDLRVIFEELVPGAHGKDALQKQGFICNAEFVAHVSPAFWAEKLRPYLERRLAR